MPIDIQRVGCIFFDEERSRNPLGTIEDALSEHRGRLADALVVLPEALDLKDGYLTHRFPGDERAPKYGFSVSDLHARAKKYEVAFVTGQSEMFNDPKLRYNSAFLIDAEKVCLLSRKQRPDPSADWYVGSCCEPRCLPYRGVMLAALICEDAQTFSAENPVHSYVVEWLQKSKELMPLLCVPARMTTGKPCDEAGSWPNDLNVCVANVQTKGDDYCSGIRVAGGSWTRCATASPMLLQTLPGPTT